jgi:hypothetical protein
MDETRLPSDIVGLHETQIRPMRMEWSAPVERLLASWCDHSKCFIWMHSRSHDEVDRRLKWFMIIIHTLSTISGLSNIITGNAEFGAFHMSWLYGGVTILLTSLALLQEKLGLHERSLNHRKLAFQSLVIKMKIEEILSLPRSARGDCKTFLRYIKADINQAMLEKNASISRKIRDECYMRFKDISGFDIPDTCGQIEHTEVYQGDYVLLEEPKEVEVAIEEDRTKYPRNVILPAL